MFGYHSRFLHDSTLTLRACLAKVSVAGTEDEVVSHVDVVDIDEFCLLDLNDMVIQLGYGIVDLMYCYFLRSRLSLDYGLHPSIVDGDVLELEKYVKDNKIILVYVGHGITDVETIFTTPRKGVVMEVDNQLRNDHIDVDSSPNVNRNFIPIPSVVYLGNPPLLLEGPTIEEILTVEETNPFEHANTRNEIIVHVDNSSTVKDVVD
ncbi:hypothetical protein Tco_0734026 [Tanacetum coccineum]